MYNCTYIFPSFSFNVEVILTIRNTLVETRILLEYIDKLFIIAKNDISWT